MKVSRTTGMYALAMLLAGCAGKSTQPKEYALDQVPAELSAPVGAADAAILSLQKGLFTRLTEEIARTGPVGAIGVCRDEAPAITAAVEAEQGVVVGRTSHRVRNPRNAPRDWVRPYVDSAAGKQAADVQAVAVDLGDRVGVLKPIPTGALCLTCHGSAETMAPEVRDAIANAYPDDQATGFAEGELRGFIWAEVKK